MAADVLIVGQGLAGSLVAWAFERAGIDFQVADAGHGAAASRVAAGIINPITGQRLARSWRFDEWIDDTVSTYAQLAQALQVSLVRPMRVRRWFRDDRERRIFVEKAERGEFGRYLGRIERDGFWIEGAVQIDLPLLISATRHRLMQQGRLIERTVGAAERDPHRWTIYCTGAALSVPRLTPVKGQVLVAAVDGGPPLAPDVILNRGHWIMPLIDGTVSIGATYERTFEGVEATPKGLSELQASVPGMLGTGCSLAVLRHEAGLRATTPDRRPICGPLPGYPRVGVLGGLGSKGALLGPALARSWASHLSAGTPFAPELLPSRWFD